MIEFRNLGDMASQVADTVGDRSSGALTKYKAIINTCYAAINREIDWPYMLRASEEVLTFTAGERYLYLPKDCDHVKLIKVANQGGPAPHQLMEALIERGGDSFDSSGAVTEWADAGEFGRKAEYSSTAEKVTITSSVAADTSSLSLFGRLNADDDLEETGILPGSEVGYTSTNTFTDLHFVSSDGTHTGVLTVAGATSGTTYATIAPGESTARYKRIRLMYVPSSSTAFVLIYKKRLMRLTSDAQVPEFPCSHYLIAKTIATIFAGLHRKSNLAAYWRGEAQMEKALLEAEVKQQGDRIEQGMPMIDTQRMRYGRRRGPIVWTV